MNKLSMISIRTKLFNLTMKLYSIECCEKLPKHRRHFQLKNKLYIFTTDNFSSGMRN